MHWNNEFVPPYWNENKLSLSRKSSALFFFLFPTFPGNHAILISVQVRLRHLLIENLLVRTHQPSRGLLQCLIRSNSIETLQSCFSTTHFIVTRTWSYRLRRTNTGTCFTCPWNVAGLPCWLASLACFAAGLPASKPAWASQNPTFLSFFLSSHLCAPTICGSRSFHVRREL